MGSRLRSGRQRVQHCVREIGIPLIILQKRHAAMFVVALQCGCVYLVELEMDVGLTFGGSTDSGIRDSKIFCNFDFR